MRRRLSPAETERARMAPNYLADGDRLRLEGLLKRPFPLASEPVHRQFDCHAVKNKVTDAVKFGYLTRRLVNSTRRGRMAILERVPNDS